MSHGYVSNRPTPCGVPLQVPVEKIVKVPVEKIVRKVVEVDVPYEHVVEKIVHVPVEKIIEVFRLLDPTQPITSTVVGEAPPKPTPELKWFCGNGAPPPPPLSAHPPSTRPQHPLPAPENQETTQRHFFIFFRGSVGSPGSLRVNRNFFWVPGHCCLIFPTPPPVPMFEADSQNFVSAPRGFKLKSFRPAFGGDHRRTIGGGGSQPNPSPPPRPHTNTSPGYRQRGCG